MPFDICCVGHITLDKVITPEATVEMPGGTAFYFSNAIRHMDVRYALVTAVAAHEMPIVAALRAKGLNVHVFTSARTVYFENRYTNDQNHRTQRVLQTADPFTPGQLTSVEATVYHLGPLLADDFPAEALTVLAQKGKVSLDVQGFLRRVEGKSVRAIDWTAKKEALPSVYFLKVNEEELGVLTGCTEVQEGAKMLAEWGVKEVIVTLGSRGSVVYDGLDFYTIPAYPPLRLQDATGCGDTYMAGYLYRRIKGSPIQQAGEFAAAMATLKINASGPFTGTEKDVEAIVKSGRMAIANP